MAKPICSCNRTSLINPNAFQIHDRLNSSPVQLEDLSIYVELATYKKGRTVLITNKQGGSSQSERPITVNFIEGSNVGGLGNKKYLTTKFTELTTVFDQGDTNSENLGITSIDIDFNSSYAPMITINFVDLRGSTIFQNDQYVKDGSNPYSVFFKLPYPLYKLKIKGYYGQPVEYCLHMTKFTSRFNSQTGNFEITASFIGYTYAMLSDMLLGVLKAIPHTRLGGSKYKDLKDPNKGGDPSLLTLNELIKKLSEINVEAQKILSSDTNYTGLSNYTNSLDKLTAIRNNIDFLGQSIDIKSTEINKFEYFIVDSGNQDVQKFIDTYVTNITAAINDYNNFINTSAVAPLDIDVFVPLKIPDEKYTNKPISSLYVNSTEEDKKITDYSKKYEYEQDKSVTIYDNTSKYTALDEQINDTNGAIDSLKKKVAQTLRNNIQTNLGFEPTVKNIIRTFTTAVEVYLSCLYDVSVSAGKSTVRTDELKTKFIPNKTVDYNGISQYYPWPTYMEEEDNVLTEKYLGALGVLKNPNNVDEIVFIDDLFNAFIIEGQQEKNFDALIREKGTNWFSTNPMDCSLFNDTPPYKREEPKTPTELAVLVVLRAMTFLGLSNTDLTNDGDVIINFAQKEAEAVISDVSNSNLLDGLANTFKTPDSFLTVTGKINNKQQTVINKNNNNYYYDYIGDEGYNTKSDVNLKKIIPIKKDFFNASWLTNSGDISKEVNDGNLLLSNYQASFYNDVSSTVDLTNRKPYLSDPATTDTYKDDGGTYVKIIEPSFFKSKANNPLVSASPNTNVTMNLEELKKFNPNIAAAGYNVFGGVYGVQEYTSLKYGNDDLDSDNGLPFRFVFIEDSIGKVVAGGITGENNPNSCNKSNGFGLAMGLTSLKSTTATIPSFDTMAYRNINGYISSVDGVNRINVGDKTTYYQYTITAGHKLYGSNRLLVKEYLKGNKNISYPYVNFQVRYKNIASDNVTGYALAPISLFGSRLYNQQTTQEAKAFLFLHTFPWKGLADPTKEALTYNNTNTIFNSSTDNGFEILNIFYRRAGFISVPKLWPAFIGGLIWRDEFSADPIKFYDSTSPVGSKSLLPIFSDSDSLDVDFIPRKWQYLSNAGTSMNSVMSFSNEDVNGDNYKPIDRVILTLPEQAKIEFKKAFTDFVNGDFQTVRNTCEIYDGTNWIGDYTSTMSTSGALSLSNGIVSINQVGLSSTYKNLDNYITFSPVVDENGVPETDFKYNIFLQFKDGSDASNLLMKLITDETILVNTSPSIWKEITNVKTQFGLADSKTLNPETNVRKNIEVSSETLIKYLEKFIEVINPKGTSSRFNDEKKQIEQDTFGTIDENAIKFMLYKSCKNIYDKWIGDVENDNIMFQCGSRNPIDYEIAKKRGGSEPKLIDSFRFVTRSFRDIGDKLAINPLPVADYLKNSPNSSFYDAVTHLLSSNNFDFIALPNFINYNDEKSLESVFQPYSTNETLTGCGPSFVCVYLGERSKNLDFGDTDSSSAYSNDGFDVICDKDGNIKNIPQDLSAEKQSYEEPVTFFNVTFGQQNQNIFKDITLDQSEFSETAESLKIMDDISVKFAETNKTLAGQNIYNVYSVRSYKVEVDMLGDAMIQPMMYFQLNNIPMFHGAYMITRVKHSIIPNHMSTKFTGVRIRRPETKIFDLNELYMSLLDTMNVTQNATTPATGFGTAVVSPRGDNAKYAPFVDYDVPESDSLKFQEHDGNVKAKGDSFAIKEAGEFMVELATKWHEANKNVTNATDVLYINNFGAYGGGTHKSHLNDKSLHAIGLACDFMPMRKDKKYEKNTLVGDANYNQAKNIELIQMAKDLNETKEWKDKIRINNIILNDETIISRFSGWENSQGGQVVISFKGHDNHIHIEFDVPPRVEQDIKNGNTPTELVTSAEIGTITTYNGALPNETEKLQALGKI